MLIHGLHAEPLDIGAGIQNGQVISRITNQVNNHDSSSCGQIRRIEEENP
jgi:hypothetical protein